MRMTSFGARDKTVANAAIGRRTTMIAPVTRRIVLWVIMLLTLATPASADMWYKGLGNDGKQLGERGVPDFTFVSNCFATSAYNSLFWFSLHGYPSIVHSDISHEENIHQLWTNFMAGTQCGEGLNAQLAGLNRWANAFSGGVEFVGTYRGEEGVDPMWLRGGTFGPPTWEFYRDELKRSEDVLLLIDFVERSGNIGRHAITGAGVGDTPAQRNRIGVSDPSDEGALPFTQHDVDPDVWNEYTLELRSDGFLWIPEYVLANENGARVFGIFAISPVPEPGTFLLVGSGLAGLAGTLWKRHRRRRHEEGLKGASRLMGSKLMVE